MNKPTIQEKALMCIEALSLESTGLSEKTRNLFYKLSHVALDTCENKHQEWRQELETLYLKLKQTGLI